MTRVYPDLREEQALVAAGYPLIAGVDEAGRGAWAGPVSAAAVILPMDDPGLRDRMAQVRDSKLCTARQREAMFDLIVGVSVAWAVSLVPASRIDQVGIVDATRQAMREAIAELCPAPDALLIDALVLPTLRTPQRALHKADLKCLSVAAASIVAKVTRDRAMVALEQSHPEYGFARHKGYGTAQHRLALEEHGPTESHRWYYAPVAEIARRDKISVPRPTYRGRPDHV